MSSVEALVKKWRENYNEINRKCDFCHEHGFEKEVEYLRTKSRLIFEVLDDMERAISQDKKEGVLLDENESNI